MPDALQLLRQDHQEVQAMFRRFESSEDKTEKGKICEKAIMELMVHAQIEEELFYPVLRRETGEEFEDTMDEADEEHHVAEMIMGELSGMRPTAKGFDAKFTVLAENVKHHIQEEESEIFPKAAELGRDKLMRLGDQLEERKMELLAEWQSGGTRDRKPAGTRKAAGSRRTAGTRARSESGEGRGRTTRTTRTGTKRTTTRARAGGTTRTTTRKTTTRTTASGRGRAAGTRSTGTRAATTRARGESRNGGSTRSRSTTGTRRSTGRKRTTRSSR